MTCREGHRIDRRRLVISGIGSVTLIGSTIVTGAASAANTADPAYDVWRSWRSDRSQGPRNLVHAAILAANAHDTQPWLFCVGADRIELYADETRKLGAMDPFRREMYISLGCALENLMIAARAQGYAPRLSVDPGNLPGRLLDGGPRYAATVLLGDGAAEISPQLAAIPRRHTDRSAYNADRSIPPEAITKLRNLTGTEPSVRLYLLTDPAARTSFAAATVAATQAIINDQAMISDSDAWFRASDAEVAAHRDGVTLEASGLSSIKLFLAKLLPISRERSHSAWLDQTREVQLATASVFGIIAVRDLYSREQAIDAGRLWQRLHLEGTLMGLAMQPLNQLPERVDREHQLGESDATAKELASLTGDPNWKSTFAFRLGWPTRSAPPSPRRDIQSVMLPETCRRFR